nr:MAG TPA: hypothetical protein [Caudoviricetes sp.]
MALVFNNVTVPQSGNVIYNGTSLSAVKMGATEVWKRQKTVYPGAPVANTQNLGYAAYFTVTNSGSDIKVDAFGGTERGYGRVMLGGFNSYGCSQIYFANLRAFITNSYSHIKVALSDINGNVVQQLIYSEANGFDATYTASTKFNINSANGNYYLMLEVESAATHLGKNATILMNGCYLI